ncbi:exported protein of unknown function [Acetoanaerobium sticklandii]|uniref:Uncharacterized protein n=1 Tax=Acetoanaerobium sticklandii (strain ATCC 12662 / DSM 519 / JCM 1433 / CCUG 9281 / NCIMB 10654 / HF) TaxID=499177 RepID=E3PUG4_ACESD|nr:S-layer homology domain-containing protein [Acetoanaerobium sticklandii]CBH22402.1 exported protein of unknown function [Acetoanaerobium sticklandii]
MNWEKFKNLKIIILSILLIWVTIPPIPVYAAENEITINTDQVFQLPAGETDIYAITISDGAQNVTIRGNYDPLNPDRQQKVVILVKTTTNLNLTLENVNFNGSLKDNVQYAPLMLIGNGSTSFTVNLYIKGQNKLTGGYLSSGIGVDYNCHLIIDKAVGENDNTAKLIAQAGPRATEKTVPGNFYTGAAGIGGSPLLPGNFYYGSGKITIQGGTIIATGQGNGAGIGATSVTGFGDIIINGGIVEGYSSSHGGAGIGAAHESKKGGKIYINGGSVLAHAHNDSFSAGIGGSTHGGPCEINITGGTVTGHAWNGSFGGAGIGSGYRGDACTINISGGQISAEGGGYGPGIGGGGALNDINKPGSTINISGGNIVSGGVINSGTYNGNAGIGGAQGSPGGTINISGGNVTAYGGYYGDEHNPHGGAGIGCGEGGNRCTINITGGEIEATGGVGAAGIGSGNGDSLSSVDEINISKVADILKITAQGGYFSAGIGGGYNSSGGKIRISGGEILATGGIHGSGIGTGTDNFANPKNETSDIEISGGSIISIGNGWGAGIGGSTGSSGGKIHISGGDITARGIGFGAAIGGGNRASGGDITLSGGTIRAIAEGINYNGQAISAVPLGGGHNGAGANIIIQGKPSLLLSKEGVPTNSPLIGAHGDQPVADQGSFKYKDSLSNITDISLLEIKTVGSEGPLEDVDISINSQSDVCGEGTYKTDSQGICTLFVKLNEALTYNARKSMFLASTGTITPTEKIHPLINLNLDSNTATTIESINISEDASYIDLTFNKGVYSNGAARALLSKNDLDLDFDSNGSTLTSIGVEELTTTNNTPLVGGENIIRISLDLSSMPEGVETIKIRPSGDNVIFDQNGDPMAQSQESETVTLPDKKAPSINNAILNVTTSSSLSITWEQATDLGTTADNLEYNVYQSISDNIGSVESAEQNGHSRFGYRKNINQETLSGLLSLTEYYFTVIVKDEAGNKACYDAVNLVSPELTTPGIIRVEKATDDSYIDIFFSDGLYGDSSQNTPISKEMLTLLFNRNQGIASNAEIISITNLNETDLTGGGNAIRVFINVDGVSDGLESIEIIPLDGNSLFDDKGTPMDASSTTGKLFLCDNQGPLVLDSILKRSVVSGSDKERIEWSKAEDSLTPASQLEYILYYSLENNITTLDEAEVNGVVMMDYTKDQTSFDIPRISNAKPCYFNVIVKDNANNKTTYTPLAVIPDIPIIPDTPIPYTRDKKEKPDIVLEKPLEVSIDVASLTKSSNEIITLETRMAKFLLPANMFTPEMVGNAKIATFYARPITNIELSKELKSIFGERPILDIGIKLDGKEFSWRNPSAPIKIVSSFQATKEELENPEKIVAWYIDDENKATPISSTKYNLEADTISFTTTHLSQFGASLHHRHFQDVASGFWAQKPIEILASKGILDGRNENNFEPSSPITRAEYLSALVKAMDLHAKEGEQFDDIEISCKYRNEINVARALGLTTGIGDNYFAPDKLITRQDMMVLTANCLQKLNRLDSDINTSSLSSFYDCNEISPYAIDSIACLVNNGLVTGDNGYINPKSNITRAETAALVYKIYQQFH